MSRWWRNSELDEYVDGRSRDPPCGLIVYLHAGLQSRAEQFVELLGTQVRAGERADHAEALHVGLEQVRVYLEPFLFWVHLGLR